MADNLFIPDADAMALMKGLPLATPEQKPRILDTLEIYRVQKQRQEQEQELQFKRTFMDPVGFGLEPDKKTLLDTTLAKSPDPRGDSFRLMNEQFLASRYKKSVEDVGRNYEAMKSVYAKDVFGMDEANDEAFFNRVGEDYTLDDELSQKAIQTAVKDLPPLAAWAESAASVNKSEAWNKSDSSVHLDKFARVFAGVSEQLAPFRDDVAEMEKRLKLAQSAEVRPEALEAEFGTVMPDQMKGQAAMREAIDILLDVPADKRPLVMMALASKGKTEGEELDAVQRLGRFFERGVEGLIVEGSTGVANMAADAGVALIESILGGTDQEMQIAVEGEQAAAPSRQEEYEQLRIQLREISQGLTPLADVKLLGMNLGGSAQSLPMTVAALVPYAGQALVIGQFRQEGIAQTMQENPGMARKDAEAIANISAPIQAAAEIFTSKLLFGKLPAFERFISSPLLTSGGLAARFGTRVAVGTGTEMLEESAQKATPLIIQEAAAALSEDVPGVDWSARMTEFKTMQLDVFTTALPLVLIGAGVGSMGDYSNGVLLAKDKDALVMSGYSRNAALEIQAKVKSGDLRGAETQMRQAADTASPEERKIAAEAFRMRSEMQSQAVAAMEANGQIASVRPIAGGKWQVINPDNSAPIEFDNFDSANAARWADAKAKDLRVHAAYRDIISQADRALKEGQENAFIFSPEKMTPEAAVEAGLVSAQAVEGRKKQLAALDEGKLEDQDFTRAEKEAQAEGDTDAVYTILGMNNIENREGVSRGVIRLFQGANFTDLIEEIAEVGFKRHFGSKEANRPAILASLRQAEGAIQRAEQAAGMEPTLLFRTKDDSQISDSDLIEAFSHLTKSYYINAVEQGGTSADWRTKNKSVPRYLRTLRAALANTEIFKWVKAMGEKLGTIYKRAAMVQEAQKAGGLDAGLEQLIRRSVGLDTQDQMEAGIIEEARAMSEEAGFSMASMSLSKGDQSLEQRLAAMFDPFQKNPEQRRKLGLIAKERVAKVAAEYADVVAMAGATREKLAALATKYSEELAASRADFQAEMKALRDERDFELEGAKQQKETKVNIEKIKADYARRIAARDKSWEKEKGDLELRQSNERGAIQRGLGKLDTESLRQAIRTLGAAISIMPSKVVAKILPGGVNELFRIKTDAGRLEAIERLVVKADVELEKFLREEITATINKKLDRYESAKDSSGRMKGKIEAAATEAIDYAVAFKALPKSSEADEVDANTQDGQVEFLEASLAKSESTAEQIQDALSKLGIANLFHDFDNLDAESLARINDWLDETIAKGRAIRRALDEERKSYLQTQKKAALSEVTKGDETSQIEAQNKESEVSSSWFQSMMDRIKGAVYAMLPTTAQQLEQIFGAESATMRHFSDRIWAAANKATDIKRDIEAKRKQAMEAIFPGMGELRQVAAITKLQKARVSGVVLNVGRVTEDVTIPIATLEKLADKTITAESMDLNDSQVEEALKQWADSKRKESATIKKVLNAGREVPLTMSELDGVQYLLSWNQPDVRTRMERNGWSQESIKQLNAFISPEARALGMWMSATYEQGAEMINPIYRRLFNAPLPRVKNYAPTYYDISGADALLPIDQQQNASGLASGFTKARRQHNENLKRVDALTAFLSHWEHVSHWVAFVEVVRDMRAVLTDKQVQAAIRQKIGSAQASSLVKRIKAIETQGNNQAWSLHELDSFFKNLNTARAFKGLAFRLSPVVKQTSALLNPLLADVPVHEYMRGLAKFATGQLEVKAMWDSDTIRRRVEGGFSPEARLAMSAKGRTVIGAQALTLMQKGMMPMQWTDAGWTSLGAAISFDFYRRQALKAGATEAMADAEAAKRLERMIATSAQPTDLVNRALIEGSPSPFTKSVWMFASESRKTLAIEVYALQRLLTGKSKSVGLDVQRVLVAHFVMGMVTQLMSGFLSLLAGDEEDREREWSLDQWTAAILAGPINGLFVLGDGVNYAIRRALGVRTFQTVSPTAKAMNDLSASALNIGDLFGDDPDAMLKEVDRLSGSIGAAAAALIGPAGAAVDVIFGNPLREADKILSDED